ncbi:hypothetical protein OE88DRAFT_495123 [Heliocybe sulcata]|uniref:Uncharacterized protein n=1 Tax=Heliocybe sulcata TaxID=5364 RepID=A0A5C3MUK4_9AGAM|nr:hypothetical protein OE88DRAFT_495123 [Heliocybe sulcata]
MRALLYRPIQQDRPALCTVLVLESSRRPDAAMAAEKIKLSDPIRTLIECLECDHYKGLALAIGRKGSVSAAPTHGSLRQIFSEITIIHLSTIQTQSVPDSSAIPSLASTHAQVYIRAHSPITFLQPLNPLNTGFPTTERTPPGLLWRLVHRPTEDPAILAGS